MDDRTMTNKQTIINHLLTLWIARINRLSTLFIISMYFILIFCNLTNHVTLTLYYFQTIYK